MQNNIVYPNFQKPKTKEEAFQVLCELTGQYWNSFSPVRPIKTAGIGLGGQALLVKRIRGKEWPTTLRLCYLCGQGILSPRELLMALGRQVVEKEDGRLDVKTGGDNMRSNPSPTLIEKVNLYGAELFPVARYQTSMRFGFSLYGYTCSQFNGLSRSLLLRS